MKFQAAAIPNKKKNGKNYFTVKLLKYSCLNLRNFISPASAKLNRKLLSAHSTLWCSREGGVLQHVKKGNETK